VDDCRFESRSIDGCWLLLLFVCFDEKDRIRLKQLLLGSVSDANMRSTLGRSRKCASDWSTSSKNCLRSLDQNDVSEQTRSNEMSPVQLPKDVVRILMLRISFLAKPIPEPSGFKHLDLTL
jgi:hypothetical protein